jgi:hypothetical protein
MPGRVIAIVAKRSPGPSDRHDRGVAKGIIGDGPS